MPYFRAICTAGWAPSTEITVLIPSFANAANPSSDWGCAPREHVCPEREQVVNATDGKWSWHCPSGRRFMRLLPGNHGKRPNARNTREEDNDRDHLQSSAQFTQDLRLNNGWADKLQDHIVITQAPWPSAWGTADQRSTRKVTSMPPAPLASPSRCPGSGGGSALDSALALRPAFLRFFARSAPPWSLPSDPTL
jgi:hypothetical protein